MKKKPLYKRILYGSILVVLWVVVFLPKKYFGFHLGAIDVWIFVPVWMWLFSKATDLDFGFGEEPYFDFDFRHWGDFKKKFSDKDK